MDSNDNYEDLLLLANKAIIDTYIREFIDIDDLEANNGNLSTMYSNHTFDMPNNRVTVSGSRIFGNSYRTYEFKDTFNINNYADKIVSLYIKTGRLLNDNINDKNPKLFLEKPRSYRYRTYRRDEDDD